MAQQMPPQVFVWRPPPLDADELHWRQQWRALELHTDFDFYLINTGQPPSVRTRRYRKVRLEAATRTLLAYDTADPHQTVYAFQADLSGRWRRQPLPNSDETPDLRSFLRVNPEPLVALPAWHPMSVDLQ